MVSFGYGHGCQKYVEQIRYSLSSDIPLDCQRELGWLYVGWLGGYPSERVCGGVGATNHRRYFTYVFRDLSMGDQFFSNSNKDSACDGGYYWDMLFAGIYIMGSGCQGRQYVVKAFYVETGKTLRYTFIPYGPS